MTEQRRVVVNISKDQFVTCLILMAEKVSFEVAVTVLSSQYGLDPVKEGQYVIGGVMHYLKKYNQIVEEAFEAIPEEGLVNYEYVIGG